MDLIRCFVAIEIPDYVKLKISDYIFSLKKISPNIKWVNSKNLHITLKFLGEIQQNLLMDVQRELSSVVNLVPPFDMSIERAGFFPNQNSPRVVWLGLRNDEKNSIFKLHEWIDKQLEPIGFIREKRRFSPHLTLGRIKFPDNIERLLEFVQKNEFHSSKFSIDKIVLMKSELMRSGAIYSKLNIYKLED